MKSSKCDSCGLYNFSGSTECRRCGRPLRAGSQSRREAVRLSRVALTNAAPNATRSGQPRVNHPRRYWYTRASNRITDVRNQSRYWKHAQVIGSTGALLLMMLFIAGIPPEPASMRLSLPLFHFAMSLAAFAAWSHWLITRNRYGAYRRFSKQIEGALTLPVSGLTVQALISLWIAFEFWSKAKKIGGIAGPMLQERARRLSDLKEFFESSAWYSLWIAILFAVAVVFIYLRYKRSPLICVIAVLFAVLLNVLINTDIKAAAAMGAASPNDYSLDWEFALMMTGRACALVNLVAFISYFAVSKRIKATFV